MHSSTHYIYVRDHHRTLVCQSLFIHSLNTCFPLVSVSIVLSSSLNELQVYNQRTNICVKSQAVITSRHFDPEVYTNALTYLVVYKTLVQITLMQVLGCKVESLGLAIRANITSKHSSPASVSVCTVGLRLMKPL